MGQYPRRKLLVLAASSTSLFAGCTLPTRSEDLHQIRLNNTDKEWQIQVRVRDENGETLFNEEYDLEANMRKEGIDPFAGEPAEIVIKMNDGNPITADWPESVIEIRGNSSPKFDQPGCNSRQNQTVSGVYIHIAGQDHVFLEPTCDTPRRS